MENRRTQLTKRIIKEALIDLLKKEALVKITVSELCEEADINRSTFYSHYANVFEVVEEMEEEYVTEYMPFVKKLDMKNYSFDKGVFIKFFESVEKNRDLLAVLLNNTNFLNDVTLPIRENVKDLYRKFWGNVPREYEIYLDADATYITFGFFATVNRWLELGCKEDSSYLYDMLNSLTKESFDKLKAQIYNIR